MIAQYDSKTMVRISGAVQNDSTAMKTIAVLTLTFLPATFVSVWKFSLPCQVLQQLTTMQAVFSMTFFNFTPGNEAHPEAWVVSEKIWIYWVISLPLTIVTILFWFMWRRKFEGRWLALVLCTQWADVFCHDIWTNQLASVDSNTVLKVCHPFSLPPLVLLHHIQ